MMEFQQIILIILVCLITMHKFKLAVTTFHVARRDHLLDGGRPVRSTCQLSTLALALRARGQRRGRDDPQVDFGRRGSSGGRERGTQARLGCREVDSRRLHWTVSRREWGEGTNVILSSSSSVER